MSELYELNNFQEIDSHKYIDELNYDLIGTYISIADEMNKLSSDIQTYIIQDIEENFETEADTELGDFLNDFFFLIILNYNNEFLHIFIQDLIDTSELNENMILCVGNHIQQIIEDKKEIYEIL
jgi:hypothetical protein